MLVQTKKLNTSPPTKKRRRKKKKEEVWLLTQQSDLAIHLLKTVVTESKRKINVM
jgi:hypothetical protein